jgi:Arc/MetJ-type ribon-helix-helix transcriptional regulator
MTNRSISISLDETLLAQLDAQGGNRSALVNDALRFWLAHRRLAALQEAYADLAQLEGGDFAVAADAAAAMALDAIDG